MKQTINYSNLEGEAKEAKALEDVKFYLDDKYDEVKEAVVLADNEEFSIIGLAMVGIEGYPATVFIRHCMKAKN